MKKMKLDILISTYGNRIEKIKLPIYHANINYIIVHQGYHQIENIELTKRNDVTYIKTNTIGLTRSRNIALNHSKSSLALISDDDVVLSTNLYEKITSAYLREPFDIGIFKAITEYGDDFRVYPKNEKLFSKKDCLNVCSIEMVIHNNCKIRFNEKFGLGENFTCCEESIYLIDAYRCNMKIKFIPEVIVSHPKISTATGAINKKILYSKGALYKYSFGYTFSLLLIIRLAFFSQFCKKFNIKSTDAFKGLINGWKNI